MRLTITRVNDLFFSRKKQRRAQRRLDPDPNRAPNQNKWHYPANFEGAAVGDGGRAMRSGAGRANANGDRWERSVRLTLL